MILRWALHFADGNSLFSGVVIVLVVWFLITFTKVRRYQRTLRLALLLGVVFIALSATPDPWWVYSIWILLLMIWMVSVARAPDSGKTRSRLEWFAGGVLVVFSTATAITEAMTLFPPEVTDEYHNLFVIGDSISAGLNEDDVLWPSILAKSHDMTVVNLAQPGAMADSAMKQAMKIPSNAGGIVLIEIGGNDLLSGKPSGEFEQQLRQLITAVKSPNRTLVMMELPLPPFANEYGRMQRQLAREHQILLISKREFARVLGMADGTVDGIHLSSRGQKMMADVIWKYVKPLSARESAFQESDEARE